MCSTGSLVATVLGAAEEILPFFKLAGSAVIELRTAIGTVHISGKHIGLSCFGRSSLVLSEFLYSSEIFFRDDGRMGILKYHPVLLIFVNCLLGFVVQLLCPEVDGMAEILDTVKNVRYRICVPVIGIILYLCRMVDTHTTEMD